jgi:hypothetical protein
MYNDNAWSASTVSAAMSVLSEFHSPPQSLNYIGFVGIM